MNLNFGISRALARLQLAANSLNTLSARVTRQSLLDAQADLQQAQRELAKLLRSSADGRCKLRLPER